jgi:Kef-type K+ transport system membrane component KefB
VPFVFGFLIIQWFGGTTISGLFVGIAVGVTSLATKSRILVDLKLLNTRVAYILMAGALISDTLALLVFAGIMSFADPGSIDLIGLVIVAGKAVAFFVVTISIGLYVLPRLGGYLSRLKFRNSTFYFTILLIITFGYAELAELAGMHSILGAFMAGLFIKDNLFPKNISKEVNKTFYDVSIGFMAPIFFVSAGFFVSLSVFQTDLTMLVSIILMAMVAKIIGTALFYLPTGNGWREGLTIGAGMNGRGAVEIIIAGIGLEMGIIDQNIFSILVFMAIFTTMTVPFLLKWTTDWLRRRGELVAVSQRSGYLILGVNPLSLLMAGHLRDHSVVCLMDSNQDSVSRAKDLGYKCIHGNALKEDVMAEAGGANFETFIGMTGNTEVNILAARLALESFKVPQNNVIVSRSESGAGMEMLEWIKATSLFAAGIDINYWLNRIRNDEFVEELVDNKFRTGTREWVKEMRSREESMLPLFIMDRSGKKRLFSFGETIEPGEKVVALK